jgi:septum formation protein
VTGPAPTPPLLVLASGSPRRRALLDQLGLAFRVVVPDVDETALPDEAPRDYVGRVAAAKARTIAARCGHHLDGWGGAPAVVLAADTTVDLDGAPLGKPESVDAARDLLGRLSARTHLVHTAVAVGRGDGPDPPVVVEVATTAVSFGTLAPAWIDWYVGTDEPYDKAGGYAVQGAAGLFVERIEGSPTNVIGLPLDVVARLVGRLGHDLLDFRTTES